jgi:DNA replicative helicase MCM subunit Mcm2 (Cdc46/Mcm family)
MCCCSVKENRRIRCSSMRSSKGMLMCCAVQANVFNLREKKVIRDLNPEDIEQLVSVSGMVTRCSNIIPEIRWFTHYICSSGLPSKRQQASTSDTLQSLCHLCMRSVAPLAKFLDCQKRGYSWMLINASAKWLDAY